MKFSRNSLPLKEKKIKTKNLMGPKIGLNAGSKYYDPFSNCNFIQIIFSQKKSQQFLNPNKENLH